MEQASYMPEIEINSKKKLKAIKKKEKKAQYELD